MKKVLVSAVVAMAAVMVFGVVVSAQTAGEEAVAVKVTGANVCLLGTYAPGAEAVAGMEKLNALKVTEALDADGKAIEGLAGRVLVYVPVKAAADLISGEANAGKSVTVNGKLFKAAGALVVESFAAAAAPADAAEDDEWDSVGTTTVTKGAVI